MSAGAGSDPGEEGAPGAPRRASEVPLPGGDFRLFVTRLSFQGMMSLGLIENPVTNTKEAKPAQARMLIDDLAMLREKTFGNLDDDEAAYLDKVLSDLRHHFERARRGDRDA